MNSAREPRLSGTLAAERSTVVSFAAMGTVEQVLVQEGQTVGPGQVLARLVSRSYEDALGIAKAKAGQAEDAYRRLEPMFQNRTLPEVKLVEVETGRQQARLALSMASKSLDDTVLRAGEAGVVARRYVEPGSNVVPGLPAFTIVQTQSMLAVAPVPETQVARLKIGESAMVTVPALRRTIGGVVREIAVIADPLTRTYDVKVALPNQARDLRVGMVAEIRVRVDGEGSALVVPPEAVRIDESGTPYVFVVTPDHKLQRRQVEVLGFVGEGTALARGVREGELVVTSGTPMLADGITVRLAGEKATVSR